jgi:3-oxoacyl-[acyl-carrier protein] reductase
MSNLSAANKLRYDLSGKAALITGAASGIGLATATMLARNGCAVAINYLEGDARGPEAVANLRQEGLSAIEAPGNVGVAGECERMVESAVKRLGRLDLLVSNAGTPGVTEVVPPARLDLITEELWETLIQVNLLGVFRCAKAAAPFLKESYGAIVSTASIAGLHSAGSSMAYGATKAAVVSMTKNLARGLAPEVRVNAIAPGAVNSSWQIQWGKERLQDSIDKAALKRRCEPEDLAEVIVFLGFGASMVTGQTIVVDGGLTL